MSKQYGSCLAAEMDDYLKLLENADKDTGKYRTTFNSLDAYLLSRNIVTIQHRR
jgi:succinate dehydrogenase flavin-adding protein (antitoxin of CptAB toxin-antitoxin module)